MPPVLSANDKLRLAQRAGTALCMAKDLVDLWEEQGVKIHYRYARALMDACPQTQRGRYIRFPDAWSWWLLNPDFAPFSEKPPKSDTTRPLSHSLAPANH